MVTALLFTVIPGFKPVLAQEPVVQSAPPRQLLPGENVPLMAPVPDEYPANQSAGAPQAMDGGSEFVPAPPAQSVLSEPSAATPELATVPVMPSPVLDQEFDENLFFDAEALVPEGEVARKGAPSKVNPSLNPASRFVISTKDYSPNSKEARLVAADRAMVLGRFESALEIYDGLYAQNRRDPNILLGRAIAFQSLNRDGEAINAYEELLKIRPKNIDAQINLNGLVGKLYPAVALQKLRDIYDDNPGNTATVAQMAVMEARLGRYEDAIRYLGTAASMEPRNAGHVFNMAVIADRAGDKKMAIKYYEEALEIDTLYGSSRSIPRDTVFARLAQLR
ncbi:MAG: tetratricopeptide repeat protein [Alphaproteobacteria bacterium]|nr:tetratricopeptide repeat protein [Alphaproteobacteria bacterium]